VAWAYKVQLQQVEKAHGKESEAYKAARSAVHTDAAQRIVAVCKKHGGMYIKFGQYLSTLNQGLPREYLDVLSELQDKATFQPFTAMACVVEEDLGRPVADVFASIEETPVAAASLAQVHRASLHDGRRVAVKIQYPYLRAQVQRDLWALARFLEAIELLFPEYGYTWMLPEFESTMRNEVNFLQVR
jgi:aarF domain-containing kinase